MFRAQCDELTHRSTALDVREAELRRLHAESDHAALRLLETQSQLDEKERLFEERSRRALNELRQQKQVLLQMRRDLERVA